MRSVMSVAFLAIVMFPSCKSTQAAPCAATQAVVESVAAQHPEVTRLTVHTVPPSGGACCAVASTVAAKLGKPSDPEDLKAMQTGETQVLAEGDAHDVTVPIQQKDGKYTAAAGVTLKAANKDEAVQKATAIAKAVEAGMSK